MPDPLTWPRLERALATVLPRLATRHCLILEMRGAHAYVQFTGFGRGSVRAETVSNQYLDARHKLDRRQHLTLLRLGWEPPNNQPPPFTPTRDARGGSPNFYVDRAPPVSWRALARLAVATCRAVHGVARPGALRYEAFTVEGAELDFPELGLRRRRRPVRAAANGPPAPAPDAYAPPPPVGLADLRIVLGPDGEVTVQGPADTLVARLHGTRDVQLAHALLLVRGDALRRAVAGALASFELLAREEGGGVRQLARDMIPLLRHDLEWSHPDVLGTR
jgi:hypothetical protein